MDHLLEFYWNFINKFDGLDQKQISYEGKDIFTLDMINDVF